VYHFIQLLYLTTTNMHSLEEPVQQVYHFTKLINVDFIPDITVHVICMWYTLQFYGIQYGFTSTV